MSLADLTRSRLLGHWSGSILNTFTSEKHIVQRERASKSYRLSAYFVAKVPKPTCVTPARVPFVVIHTSITWLMDGHLGAEFLTSPPPPLPSLKILSEVPMNIVACSIFATLVFWTGNLYHTWDRYLLFLAIINCVTMCGSSLGLMIASLAPNADAANGLAPLFNISLMLLSGFLSAYAGMQPQSHAQLPRL
jgi:ABC-type multidrug transport system permease subunit